MTRKLRLGMVGGGQGAFIGAVHRIAARLDDRFELVAGALSSDPERAQGERGEKPASPAVMQTGARWRKRKPRAKTTASTPWRSSRRIICMRRWRPRFSKPASM